jgi:toxin HigB-1
MNISFRTRQLQKACNSAKEMAAEWGPQMAKKLQQRLMELSAAETLAQISRLPPARCHEHTGNNKGMLTVDLVHPMRLMFKPDHQPIPVKPDGGLDWTKVTAIIVVDVLDPH